MLVLGIDTSAVTASCAVTNTESGKIIAQFTINAGHTHSQTLMPMLEAMLKTAGLNYSDIDLMSVSASPGSFTGLRIGVSTVKGIAFALNKPCAAVSALEALAYNLKGRSCIVCSAMDARRNQIYNALFRVGGKVERLCADRAVSVSEVVSEIEKSAEEYPVVIVGDGAEIVYKNVDNKKNIELAPPLLRYQLGSSVCFAAENADRLTARTLMPGYLRLPQAERERLEKLKE